MDQVIRLVRRFEMSMKFGVKKLPGLQLIKHMQSYGRLATFVLELWLIYEITKCVDYKGISVMLTKGFVPSEVGVCGLNHFETWTSLEVLIQWYVKCNGMCLEGA